MRRPHPRGKHTKRAGGDQTLREGVHPVDTLKSAAKSVGFGRAGPGLDCVGLRRFERGSAFPRNRQHRDLRDLESKKHVGDVDGRLRSERVVDAVERYRRYAYQGWQVVAALSNNLLRSAVLAQPMRKPDNIVIIIRTNQTTLLRCGSVKMGLFSEPSILARPDRKSVV